MQRRTFLKAGIGSGAAAALLPAWSTAQATGGANPVPARISEAASAGKPVLVLLIPEKPSLGTRLEHWSELFTFADDATLAELALCEVVCAAPSQAAAAARSAGLDFPELEADDVALLLEPGGGPPRRVSGRDLGSLAPPSSKGRDPFEQMLRQRASDLAGRVRAALLPDEGALARRAAASRQALRRELDKTLLLWHHPRPLLANLHRAAAIVLAEAREAKSAEMESNLACAALQRLWDNAPDGARWSVDFDAGKDCPGCGMAMLTYTSWHFLTVYTG